MSYAYRIGKSTVSQIILETCNAIWDTLNKQYLLQSSEESWMAIANDFNNIWQLPHYIGAMDGKHCIIQAPPKSGSEFFNYKKTFSIIIFALCDAKYKFTIIDIGAKGKQSDGGVLHNSELGRRLNGGFLNIPSKRPLAVGQECFPYYFVGDEKENLKIPYPGKYLNNMKKVFNYRRPIIATLATSDALVKATICLHNFLMANNEIAVGPCCPPSYVDCEENGVFRPGLWKEQTGNDCLLNLGRSSSNTYTRDAAAIRNNLAIHFMTEGAIEFQWNKASGM